MRPSLALLAIAALLIVVRAQNETEAKKIPTKAQKAAMINKVVAFAPAANVTFGDDIASEGGAYMFALVHACKGA